jgi:uncharacterized SAM-binding protein YcdF (DUF218 family)
VAVALRTLAAHDGGRLVVSGHRGEAERLAALALGSDVIVEPTAQTTWDNVERSIPHLEDVERIAIASDWFHARQAGQYLLRLRPDLGSRVVSADRRWWHGWWIQAGGGVHAAAAAGRRVIRAR